MNIENIKIGDKITPKMGAKLADQLGFTHISKRIYLQPDRYKSFIFDGCSCFPDELFGLFTGCRWQDITYLCCLPHDISYAYGEIGDEREKRAADYYFYHNLIHLAGMRQWLASIFMKAVKFGGAGALGLSFSWGFARLEL